MFWIDCCDKLNNIGDGFLLLAVEHAERKEEPKTDPDLERINSEFQKLNTQIIDEINSKYPKEFEAMLRTDEWKINGDILHANFLSHDRIKQMDELLKEDIDEDKDWDKYIANYKKRACILIKEIEAEPDKFDKIEYYPLENLLTAWGRRISRGFHMLDKPLRKSESNN